MRQRIALMFILLSSLVYLTLTLLGAVLFHSMMIKAIDNELRAFASSLGHAIDVRGQTPFFRDWLRVVQTEPARSLVTIQLFDPTGRLLEQSGRPGSARLLTDERSVTVGGSEMRVLTTPLLSHGKLVGYMQLELPQNTADEATRQFALTMAMIAPLVLAGLAGTSLIVSGQVVRPFVDNMSMLRRFVADAGHELNTPLAIAQGRIESLAKKFAKEGISTRDFESIDRSLARMSAIVTDLSLLTEVEGPLASQPKSDIDLNDLIAKTVDDFRLRFKEKNINLSYTPSTAEIRGYPDALQRLLINLLENALRYTEPGGTVSVKVTSDDRHVRLAVADTGIGIPAESLPMIFDRFYRVDRSRSRASGGTGLGLSIVRAIAEAHGGSVRVSSELGKGSEFVILLPA